MAAPQPNQNAALRAAFNFSGRVAAESEREQQERWSESAAQWSAPEAHTEDGAPEQIESGEEEKK